MSMQAKSGINPTVPAKIRCRKGKLFFVFQCPHWKQNHPWFKNHWIRAVFKRGFNCGENVTLPCGGTVNLEVK